MRTSFDVPTSLGTSASMFVRLRLAVQIERIYLLASIRSRSFAMSEQGLRRSLVVNLVGDESGKIKIEMAG